METREAIKLGKLPLDKQRNLTGALENISETRENYWKARKLPDFYDRFPPLSCAKEIALTLNKNLISPFLISAFKEGRHPKDGDNRKKEKFQRTFGKFLNCEM